MALWSDIQMSSKFKNEYCADELIWIFKDNSAALFFVPATSTILLGNLLTGDLHRRPGVNLKLKSRSSSIKFNCAVII